MKKINLDEELNKNPDSSYKNIIYEAISNQLDIHYYKIMGLELFMSSSNENKKSEYVQKIYDFAKSLENDEFKIHYAQEVNPKIECGKVFAYKGREKI